MSAVTAIEWATLLRDPAEPREGNYGGRQHMATVAVNGAEHKVWIDEGQFSALRRGDVIMVEFRAGKWRMSKSQPPELIRTLQSRAPMTQTQTPPPVPAAPLPVAQPSQAPAKGDPDVIKRALSLRAALLRRCHQEVLDQFSKAGLELRPEELQKYATALYIDLSKML